ncbi:MAG: molybdopterin adenylyltransferase [Pseudomonadota bacterium]
MIEQFIKIGLISISDRASSGVYADKGIPSLQEWLEKTVITPIKFETRLIADEQDEIEETLMDLVDYQSCHLIFTTGGTGPSVRDVTPEATLKIADKIMPGFGEQMRQISLNFVPTAILSRQVAVIRKQCLIVNLPGQPKAIAQTLEGLKDDSGNTKVHGIFAAIPYCLDLLATADSPMPYLETNASIVQAFRPKSAFKPA